MNTDRPPGNFRTILQPSSEEAWRVRRRSRSNVLEMDRTAAAQPAWSRDEHPPAPWLIEAGSRAEPGTPGRTRCFWHFGSRSAMDGLHMKVDNYDGGLLQLRIARRAGHSGIALRITSKEWERYHGLGERFDRLELSGRLIDCIVSNSASGGTGYKPIPLLYSNSYYGLVVTSTYPVSFGIRHPAFGDWVVLLSESSSLDVWLALGNSYRDLFSTMTRVVGRPPETEDWMFGVWRGGDWRSDNKESVVSELREAAEVDAGYSVKVIDAGWENPASRFVFDKNRYPDFGGLVRSAGEVGCRVGLGLYPAAITNTATHAELTRLGFLVRDENGNPYEHTLGNDNSERGSLIDFTCPAAVKWWEEQIGALIDAGAKVFKVDFGELVRLDARFWDGRSGREVHNEYPYLYNEATLRVVRRRLGNEGITIARSAWSGSQNQGAFWAGDQSSDFNPWTGLRSVILAAQNAGISGLTLWGCDIGGYFAVPSPECFIRWAQFAALTPIMLFHGLGIRNPWEFGKTASRVVKSYMKLHESLTPYSAALSAEARETGYPPIRALAIEYPDCADSLLPVAEREFLYGPDLLVAPVDWETEQRPVYIPPGKWISYWTGELVTGEAHLDFDAPLDVLPLWVRHGAVLPRHAQRQGNPRPGSRTPVVLEIYPGAGRREQWTLGEGLKASIEPGPADRRQIRIRSGGGWTVELRGRFCKLRLHSDDDHTSRKRHKHVILPSDAIGEILTEVEICI